MAEEGKKKEIESKNGLLETMMFIREFAEYINENTPNTAISVIEYDRKDEPICTMTGTFNEIFDRIKWIEGKTFPRYYYRIAVMNQETIRERVKTEYFGVQISCPGGFKFSIEETLNRYLNRMIENYAKGQTGNFTHLLVRYLNYSKKLSQLHTNDAEIFEAQLSKLKKKYKKLVEVKDLGLYKQKEGIYVLVLDEYHVCYIGQSCDIRKRIMRHWSRHDYFSGTGIDMFKAYDTTRIFVLECSRRWINTNEYNMVNLIDSNYTLNGITGGDIEYHIKNKLPIAKAKGDKSEKESVNFFVSILEDMREAEKIAEKFGVKADES